MRTLPGQAVGSDSALNLLFTIPDFWPNVRRGSERVVHDLSVVMSQRGHQVVVLTRSADGHATTRTDEGFRVVYANQSGALLRLLRADPMEGFALTAAMGALMQPADLHHAFYLTDAYGLSLASALRRRPFIFSWHGLPERRWWETYQPRTHRWYMRMMRRASRVTVMTEASAEQLRQDYDYDPVVLTPGIFVEAYDLPKRPLEGRTIVCAAAVDDPRKRIGLLVEAFGLLAREHADVRLLLVGAGDPAGLLALRAAMPADVAARISWRPETDLPSAYASCTVGALTSLKEAFGLVVVEYLAAGMPAVVSSDGGGAEIISRETGVAFAAGDAGACAQALDRALALARDDATSMRCKQRAQLYDWSQRASAYENLYQELA